MKLMLLAKESEGTNRIYNAINKSYKIESVIFEKKISRKKLIIKRIKKFGILIVVGQLIFQTIVVFFLRKTSAKRIHKIKKINKLNSTNINSDKISFVDSVNGEQSLLIIKKYSPDVIIVNGTRIISKKILSSTNAIFLNTHVGITPKYRGVHGAYWALVNKDMENCGVTVHVIDEGIDTGDIIYQKLIKTSSKDNFVTYPLLQNAIGIQILKKALKDIEENNLRTVQNKLESNLWSHPTVFQYIYNRIINGVK